VGTVTSHTSFKLTSSPATGGAAVNATAAGTSISLEGDLYTVLVSAPSPDTHTITLNIQLTPGGVLCQSSTPSEGALCNGNFYPAGSPVIAQVQ
jgi:hypothetical protein